MSASATTGLPPPATDDAITSEGHASLSRVACRVALDLRTPGQAIAVAVDKHGALVAWARARGAEPPAVLAVAAAEKLTVTVRELRVALGAPKVAVGGVSIGESQDADATVAALAREGFTAPSGPHAWLVLRDASGATIAAACSDVEVATVADRFDAAVPAGPEMVADLQLLAASLERGRGILERTDAGIGLAVRAVDGGTVVRRIRLPAAQPLDDAILDQVRRTLETSRVEAGATSVIGRDRSAISTALASASPATLPRPGDGPALPDDFELAWRLATATTVPALESPDLERRAREIAADRRVVSVGVLIFIVGLAIFLVAMRERAIAEERLAGLTGAFTEAQRKIEELTKVHALKQRTDVLETRVGELELALPEVATLFDDLARRQPPKIGWERVALNQGRLLIEVSAAGSTAEEDLRAFRRLLQGHPRLVNVTWQPPIGDEAGLALLQSFAATATLRPAASPSPSPAGTGAGAGGGGQ